MRTGGGLALALGVATGIRSTAGLAILATSSRPPAGSRLASRTLRRLATGTVVGETVADKAAPLPPRTDPLPLAGRALLGGTTAALGAAWAGSSRLGAALLGAVSAAGAAWAATAMRAAVRERGLPDLLPALAEDLVVVGLGAAAHGVLSRAGPATG